MKKNMYFTIITILSILIIFLFIVNITVDFRCDKNDIVCDSEEDILRELSAFFELEMDTITLKYTGKDKNNVTVDDVDTLCDEAFTKTECYLYNWQNIKQKEIRMRKKNNAVYITVSVTHKQGRKELEFVKEKIKEIADELRKQNISDFNSETQYMMIAESVSGLYMYDDEKDDASYEMYGALTSGKGVCKVYALTYKAIADELGIGENVRFLGSDADNHSLNEVNVNGAWMYIDVTNYDTEKNRNYLLFSDYKYPISFTI